MEDFRAKLNERTSLISLTAASNVLGIINPIKGNCPVGSSTRSAFGRRGSIIPHMKIDVPRILDILPSCREWPDLLEVSSLPMARKLLEQMSPVEFGGEK